ncbi:rho GTPase-activating protein 23-like isoform X3 [Hypomesus transpacificus]|uniref:rho GTPase-activating protein 23-like isoform X3 n=1 Tax=Hypomesus transpacificus TaxID=137520 RepID=UPI001F086FB5|nr:rho GTPase-activating protein 23-like isoform X3 [Hypomesus transpacificus]
MPAAMLPSPAPARSEWCFQNAVGVDCSSPEPRCIWLAVLRGAQAPRASPSPPAMPARRGHAHLSRGQQCFLQPRAKGRRDGLSSASDNPRPALVGGPGGEGVSVGWHGPRTLLLHKNSQGFGFTLRHFIVYPPESALHTSLKDEENGNGKGYPRSRLEPMDTIFVKNVRERGPAHQAGLCTGDRLVKVNGESVLGKTYSQVIALIQNSDSVLELSIMPKDEDVLQLVSAYSQDAYLRGNDPYTGGAQNLPVPPPLCYPRGKSQPPSGGAAPMGQNQLDNWSRWAGSSSPSSPLDNRSAVGSPASWQEGRAGEPGGVGHSSPAHRTEEIQYGMTGQQPMGQTRGRSYSSSSSSGGPLSSPLHVHYANHNTAAATATSSQGQPRMSSQVWASSPPQPSHSRGHRCQQALSDWYYSQVPEQSVRSMPPRHRSYSQDRLGETGGGRHPQRPGGWPHSASQDTLLLLQQAGPHGDHYWTYGEWEGAPPQGHPAYGRARSENQLVQYDRYGRSLEMLDREASGLVSPRYERPAWLPQAPQPPPRTEAYQRQGNQYGVTQAPSVSRHSQSHHKHPHPHTQPHPQHQPQPQQTAPQSRRLPTGQSMDDQPVGYRSYSPSFYRKTGRIMQQAHSFRDPSYSGPHLNWAPTPKTSPPDAAPATTLVSSTAAPLASATPEPLDRAYRPTNHERGAVEGQAEVVAQIQEVVLRQKPPTGRRNAHAMRHPHYALPVDAMEPSVFPLEPLSTAPAPRSVGEPAPRRTNGNLAPLPVEDDSLASIPFIDEPTSPSADLRARHVPASSVVSSGMSSAPAGITSPASPTFTFPLTRLFSHDCTVTTERSKSCDEGLNSFRDEGRVFSRLPKRVKSFFADGSLDSLGAAEEARSKRHSTSELGSISYSDVRREGWLHYKQILTEKGKVGGGTCREEGEEKGKKVGSGMRPWKRVFSVLRSHSLFLYKDKREAVLRGATLGGAEDEQPISIRGCLVDIAYSETKRKHALRLTTQDFCEYLLQADDREDMLDWIKVIRENSKTDNEELGFSRQALISKKLNDYRKHSPTGSKPDSSPRVPRMKPPFLAKMETAAGAPRSPKSEGKDESSPPKSPWGINIMKKTKKSGPKAFGVRLEDCQPAVKNKFIPMIVEICCGLVEDMGLEYTGIYRVPGNNAMVSSLQDQLNKGLDINPAEEKWQDLNVVSSLLKSFFRKLPEPLFTDDKYNDFIEANRMENTGDRLKTMKKLIRDLPDYYYHTLKFLVGHLKTVADSADKNKMEPRNLALVFGPTLVRTSEDNMTDMVTHMPDRYKIVETLIQHHAWFFSEEVDKDEKTPVDTEDLQPAPNIDHLLSNIGRTGLLGEASDSTNSDSAKSKGSWGTKRDLTAKDFLTLSIMSAVTGRKRRKGHNGRPLGSSTDDDSEHEPIKASHLGEEGIEEAEVVRGDIAPRAVGEEDEEEEEEEEEDRVRGQEEVENMSAAPSRPCGEKVETGQPVILLPEEEEVRAGVKGRPWGPEDARSIVSGYSTLSTLGRSLASEGRGDDADDEQSELVSETDNESGFASRSLTQERPEKHPPVATQSQPPAAPRSFLYTHCKPPAVTPPPQPVTPTPSTHTQNLGEKSDGGARSSTPSSSSFSSSSTTHRLHPRPSFNSHKLIQCDTLARKKSKGEKAKARSLDLLELAGPLAEREGAGTGTPGPQGGQSRSSRTNPSSGSSQESLRPVRPKAALPPSEAASFTPSGQGQGQGRGSLADQVRARLLGSADDLRSVGLRKPLSPETRRKRRAWRRHTVVVSPTETGEKRHPLATSEFPLSPAAPNQAKAQGAPRDPQGREPGEPLALSQESASTRRAPASRFHQYL